MKYTDTQVVFRELPDEITLAVNISGCPLRCEGCHSPYLRENIGTTLTKDIFHQFIRENKGITAICFMGGDSYPLGINEIAKWFKEHYPLIKIGWYSGQKELPHVIDLQYFNYIKLGPYNRLLGGLDSPTTNQRLYNIEMSKETDYKGNPIYKLIDITQKLQKSI